VAVSSENSGSATAAVKSKTPNSLGLYDMSGNVWQRCLETTVTRGGAYNDAAQYKRVGYVHSDTPSYVENNHGFRIVRRALADGTEVPEGQREVTVAMWDSRSDGWDHSAALRINVNGTDLSTNARLDYGGGPGYHTFTVNTGDAVQIYWVNGGTYDYECAFAVYYSVDPPNPGFDPSTGTADTGRVLVSKRYDNPSGAVGNGTLMGSFTVP